MQHVAAPRPEQIGASRDHQRVLRGGAGPAAGGRDAGAGPPPPQGWPLRRLLGSRLQHCLQHHLLLQQPRPPAQARRDHAHEAEGGGGGSGEEAAEEGALPGRRGHRRRQVLVPAPPPPPRHALRRAVARGARSRSSPTTSATSGFPRRSSISAWPGPTPSSPCGSSWRTAATPAAASASPPGPPRRP
ncbi:hypothetical protein PAHAL_9G169700 [Panicum hallii]|uniref:Uncharacterized protein n=1 Tax=Panicum hallii TaxID=206008 RepID=A0A2T8I1J6_9POAL|nr:hypothetical protein PAHAL_9G169700 [Panicum hallii]